MGTYILPKQVNTYKNDNDLSRYLVITDGGTWLYCYCAKYFLSLNYIYTYYIGNYNAIGSTCYTPRNFKQPTLEATAEGKP